MAILRKRLFFTPADTTAETVFTNVSGQVTRLESMTMAQPSTAAATVIRLSIGVDGATTRVIEYPLDAGARTVVVYPNIILTGTETLQLSSTGTDDVVVCTGSGTSDLVA